MIATLVLVLLGLLVAPIGAQMNDLDINDLKTIKNQLNVLMEKRQQDYEQMEKSLFQSLRRNLDLVALKEEIKILRSEQLKISQSGDGGDRDKVAVGWLKDVIESLKSEIQDVWSAINETAQIHKATTLQNDIQALKKDLDGIRKDLQTMQGELLSVRKNVENAAILQIELEKKLNSLIKYQNTVNKKNEELEEKQMATIYKRVAISNEDPLQTNVITTIVTDQEIKELKILESSRKSLNHRMARLEKRIKGILYRESSIVERENRLSRLEVNLNATKEAIAFNLTRQDATLDRLHGSLLELLESVETLDDRVDACLPEVRKEISKIEFAVARINASVAIIKEDQNNQMLTTKALGEGMSAIQRTLSKTSEKIFISDKITKDSHQKYTSALNELDSLHKPYGRIIGELPKDCSQINENGEYLISSNGKAILVHCEISKNMSWITFQRRTNDQLTFNNIWTEYSEGFGQVYGDLWLGNEAIHQLTSDNKSSLQINMIDIYGNFWIAEYKNFKVSNASTGYLLSVSGFKGNATDALSFQNGHKFSTLDHDQDDSTTNCAANYEGGWWYSRCQHANLNGKYNYGLTWFDSSRNQYIAISKSEMKIGRPIV
ncbi:protein scabrous [Daktulosphaira vitifoliae]|uniref:protein scabrous n=1 Tax=Daktulosphaira vitifoliae TaxID=58002 RepID=UPI0021AAF65B|nr:protein scabrous [Daktulosphaira vitifoliae]